METALSIGNFDGLHLGHIKLLKRLIEASRERGLRSLVISYDAAPACILNRRARPLLLLPPEIKKKRLLELGIDQVELLHFDEQLSLMSADEFLHELLIPRYRPQLIVVGYDSHFGFQRRGDLSFLRSHTGRYGYLLEYVEPLLYQGKPLSSSLIREMLLAGDVGNANELLDQPYALFGKIVPGAGIGTALGFPTANLELADPHQLVPKNGIYFSQADLGDQRYFGLTNIGISPTVKHKGETEIETHLLDFSGQIYGRKMDLSLLGFLREEKTFENREELKQAIAADVARARKLIREGAQ